MTRLLSAGPEGCLRRFSRSKRNACQLSDDCDPNSVRASGLANGEVSVAVSSSRTDSAVQGPARSNRAAMAVLTILFLM